MSDAPDARVLARNALDALDALLSVVRGGEALEALVDAREALSHFAQRTPQKNSADDRSLTVQLPALGGVTLMRGSRSFTIDDDELELVRDAVNTRKREVRKKERRRAKSED